jgi:hypothetical protein
MRMIIGHSLTHLNPSRTMGVSVGVPTTRAPKCKLSVQSARREFLDHVLFWNGRDLERKRAEFQVYYNGVRCMHHWMATRR